MKIAELKEMIDIEKLAESNHYLSLNEIKEILEIADITINPSTLGRALREKACETNYSIKNGTNYANRTTFLFMKAIEVIDCIKEKNILYIVTTEEEKIPYYDFREYEYLANQLDFTFGEEVKKSIDLMRSMLSYWLRSEWIYSYLDKNPELLTHYPKTIEKGCIKILEKLSVEFNSENIMAINFAIVNKIEVTRNYFRYYARLHEDVKYVDKLMKLRIVDAKALEDNSNWRVLNFIKDAESYNFEIDYNRTSTHNIKLFESFKEREQNKILAKKLQEINEVNGKTVANGTYTIVVPQGIADLQNEGSMQNNCVGYYYNNSIVEGRYHILFVRKTNSIDKSYITCRLDAKTHEVYEFRYKNNAQALNNKNASLIKEIENLF